MANQKQVNDYVLLEGTATPYLAIFSSDGTPVKNPLTGVPLGAYISSFTFKYDEKEENLATLVIETGNPDTVDIQELQEGNIIFLQWGYWYPNGKVMSSPVRVIKIRDLESEFNDTGTHITLKCIDANGDLRYRPPFTYTGPDGVKFSDYLDSGMDSGDIGIIIERFE